MGKSFLGTPGMPSSRHPINTFDKLRVVKYTFSHSSATRLPKNDLPRVLTRSIVLRAPSVVNSFFRGVYQERKFTLTVLTLLSIRERHARCVLNIEFIKKLITSNLHYQVTLTDPLIQSGREACEKFQPENNYGLPSTRKKVPSLLTSFFTSCASPRFLVLQKTR